MTNTSPLDPHQPGGDERDLDAPGGAAGPAPAGSPVAPAGNPVGAQAAPGKRGGLFGFLGNLVEGAGEDWRKERQFKRELRRTKALAQQAAEHELRESQGQKADSDAPVNPEELLEQERNKRIRMISEFTDVKETFDHKIKRIISSIACAVVPWLLVIFLTSDVGEYFAGKPFTMDDFQTVGIFGLTALLEIVIAVVTNAWGNTTHDANATEVAADKQKMRDRAKTQAAAWGVLSLVSGFALFMFLMQQQSDNAAIASGSLTAVQVASGLHAPVVYSLSPALINVVLRVLGTLAIDPACVFAVHSTTKNLDQFLKQQNQITTGITQISDSFDKQQEAAARAQMRQKENERFLELKGKMDDVNATMFGRMGEKMLEMSDQMFDHMQLPAGKVVDADEDDGRNVRRLRR